MKLLLTVCISLLIFNCKKDRDDGLIQFSGKLLEDCSGTPCVNCQVKVVIEGGYMVDDKVFTSFTNSEGDFTISCEEGYGDRTRLEFSSNSYLVVENSDREVGTTIKKPTGNFALRIKISDRFLDTDTLYYPYKFTLFDKAIIPCSVRDTILPPIYNFSSTNYRSPDCKYWIEPVNKGTYSVRRRDSAGRIQNVYIKNYWATMKLQACTGRLDTVTVFIE